MGFSVFEEAANLMAPPLGGAAFDGVPAPAGDVADGKKQRADGIRVEH